jgi:hypothetical protein
MTIRDQILAVMRTGVVESRGARSLAGLDAATRMAGRVRELVGRVSG